MPKGGLWLGNQTFSIGEGADSRKFSGVAYSGGEITDRLVFANNKKMYGKLVIDVPGAAKTTASMNHAGMTVPSFYNHDQNQPVGHGKIAFSNDITIDGKFLEHSPAAIQVLNMMKEGFPMQQSVYAATDDIEGIDSGVVKLNGREFQAPLAILRNVFIREVSLCPIGADPHTDAQIFTSQGFRNISEIQETKGDSMEKFTWMNDEQKKQYSELAKTDQYAAFEFAQKLCPCSDEQKAKDEAAAKADEEKKKEEEKTSAKASDDLKSENEKLAASVKELSTKVESLTKENEKFKDLDPSLFKKDVNTVDETKTKAVVIKAKELMAANPGMEYMEAYKKAASSI